MKNWYVHRISSLGDILPLEEPYTKKVGAAKVLYYGRINHYNSTFLRHHWRKPKERVVEEDPFLNIQR